MSTRILMLVIFCLAVLSSPLNTLAYPLDGYEHTNIPRLEGYRLAQEGKTRGRKLHPGALKTNDTIQLRLHHLPEMSIPPVDAKFQQQINDILWRKKSRYSISIIDLTNPDQPFYAEHRANKDFNPGSLGKLIVALALFNELAKAFPDTQVRESILRDTFVSADELIIKPSHVIPFWDENKNRLKHRKPRIGDKASLWTWLDWMLSASSNSAASMVMKQVILLHHFGSEYPSSTTETQQWFQQLKPMQRVEILREALDSAVTENGFDNTILRQGGLFTRMGKRRVPTGGSRATSRELIKFLLHLEQGTVVDYFSSLEIKRLLYMTQKRIRYASSPALRDSAIYFKSGSLYSCKPEPEFVCQKYKGNKRNLLNSVAIVESPEGLHYIVVVSSNILRKNSAVEHQSIATFIHRLMKKRHPDLFE